MRDDIVSVEKEDRNSVLIQSVVYVSQTSVFFCLFCVTFAYLLIDLDFCIINNMRQCLY